MKAGNLAVNSSKARCLGLQELLRLIEIDGVDINPCGGTHLGCTSQLQVLKIVGLEKSRGQARLRFMVGGRVIAALGASMKRETALNKVCFSNKRRATLVQEGQASEGS